MSIFVIAEAVTDGDGVKVKVPEDEPGEAVGVTTAEANAEALFAGETVIALLRHPLEVPFTSERTIVLSMKVVPL